MAYTDPPTFVAGDVLAASELNVVSDDIRALYAAGQGTTFSGVQLRRSTDQAIPHDTATAVTWTTEVFDYGGWWSSGSSVTVPSGAIPAGYTTIAVLIQSAVRFDANGTGTRWIAIYVNGAALSSWGNSAISGETTDAEITDVAIVSAGDVLTFQVKQTSGSSLDANLARVTIVRLGPAS